MLNCFNDRSVILLSDQEQFKVFFFMRCRLHSHTFSITLLLQLQKFVHKQSARIKILVSTYPKPPHKYGVITKTRPHYQGATPHLFPLLETTCPWWGRSRVAIETSAKIWSKRAICEPCSGIHNSSHRFMQQLFRATGEVFKTSIYIHESSSPLPSVPTCESK